MGEAREKLGASLPGLALGPERAALAELQRAKDAARQSLDDLQQMQGMRQGSSGKPMGMME